MRSRPALPSFLLVAGLVTGALSGSGQAQQRELDPLARIRDEGLNRSRVMETAQYLTDVIGPRLTNSPGCLRANEWTRDQLASWGAQNAALEPWGTFGRGWTLKRFSAELTEPQSVPLIAYPKAWSPGTRGTLNAPLVYVDAKTEADLEQYRGKLKGAIVLLQPVREAKPHLEPRATRKTDQQLLELANAGPAGTGRRRTPPTPEQRQQQVMSLHKVRFAADEGAALIVDPSRPGDDPARPADGGTLFVTGAAVPQPPPPENESAPAPRRPNAYDPDLKVAVPPQIVLSVEQYNRCVRLLQSGEKLRMRVDLQVEFQDRDLQGYNTVAEIPGTDRKDEVVMLGAHLDSWHSSTGATDNAAGVAVCMEIMRILKALNLQPRRTVRVALWTGEEQGLLGSRGYVAKHFGKLETPPTPAGTRPVSKLVPGPEYEKISAYYNLDNGTGKIRGIYLQGNEQLRPLFRDWLAPFRDLGASTVSAISVGSTDHAPFDSLGIPAFQFIQDELEYPTRTHHSNQDSFDRLQADDLKQAATIMATFVYRTAVLDNGLARKPAPAR